MVRATWVKNQKKKYAFSTIGMPKRKYIFATKKKKVRAKSRESISSVDPLHNYNCRKGYYYAINVLLYGNLINTILIQGQCVRVIIIVFS